MCSTLQEWDKIDPSGVAAKCLTKNRRAFLNVNFKNLKQKNSKNNKNKKNQKHKSQNRSPSTQAESITEVDPTTTRWASERQDRIQCAIQFERHTAECMEGRKKLNGKVQHPHDLVKQYEVHKTVDEPILEAQWMDLREHYKREMANDAGTRAALENMIPLVDVSLSMQGDPMRAAVGIGILLAELNSGMMSNRFITFESEPTWHHLPAKGTLREKITDAMSAGWGGSTNLSRALGLILDMCKRNRLRASQVSQLKLVVLSDMQFDAAHAIPGCMGSLHLHSRHARPWETQYEELRRQFSSVGRDSKEGEPWPVPRIIFWNLRGDTKDFPVTSTQPGVDMVSGFSPSLLKLFLSGDLGNANELLCPARSVREALGHARYDAVRAALR